MSVQLEGLRRFVAQRPPAAAAAARVGRVVVVGSGKGGVGTSTVAALVALVASAEGRSVLLVDAVTPLGAQHLLFGTRPPLTLSALRGGDAEPHDLPVAIGERLALVSAADGTGDTLPAAEHRALFQRLSALFPGYDLVVVDGGSRLDGVVAACQPGAARLLAVTIADRIALAATHALIKVVGARLGPLPVDVVVNRSDDTAAVAAFGELQTAAERFLQRSIGFAGAAPDDGCIAAGVAAGMAIHEAASSSPATLAVQPVVQRLLRDLAGGRHRASAGYAR